MSVPSGWQIKSLTDLANYINGAAFSPDDWGKDGLPIIRIEQLKNPSAPTDYYAGRLPAHNLIHNGDLIFSWSASLFLKIWQNGPAALNQHLFKVIEKDGIDRHFLKSFIEYHLEEITKAAHGSTMRHITRKELDRFSANIPENLHEQVQIAIVLSAIDKVIAQTDDIIAKQQRIKTGLMQDLLTRGIDEHGNIRSEKTHTFEDSPIGRIPAEWEVLSFREIISRFGGKLQTGPFGSQLHAHEYETTGIPVVMPQDISGSGISTRNIARITLAKSTQLGRHKMLPGDLIFARRGDLSRCTYIKDFQHGWVCGTGCLLMRLPIGKLSSRWASEIYRFHTTQLQVGIQAVGSTMANLNTSILSALIVPLPTFDEQVRIEQYLNSVEKIQSTTSAHLKKLRRQKSALMQDLLTGKVRVTPLLGPEP